MPVIGDERAHAITTLVAFHDLLGFGDLVASSGGTLDSAVGQIALQRIHALRATAAEAASGFPEGTAIFHFNDTITAMHDIEFDIGSSHTDPDGIASEPVSQEVGLTILRFVGASAELHQACIRREEEGRLGPAGRTFVVLGSRWNLSTPSAEGIQEVPWLHANLAFAEAYAADAAGSAAGFPSRSYDRVFLNDYLWFSLVALKPALTGPQLAQLNKLGLQEREFPQNLLSPKQIDPVVVSIFHRRRRFFSVMSHHTKDLLDL